MAINFLGKTWFFILTMLVITPLTAAAVEPCVVVWGDLSCKKPQCSKVYTNYDYPVKVECRKYAPKSSFSSGGFLPSLFGALTRGSDWKLAFTVYPGAKGKDDWVIIDAKDGDLSCECIGKYISGGCKTDIRNTPC